MKYLPFLLFFLISCSQLGAKKFTKVSILQGVTNSREVEFSIVTEEKKELTFELRSFTNEVITPEEVRRVERESSDYVVYKIVFARDPQTEYNLFVFHNGQQVDQRLVGKGQKESTKLRVAVVSGFNDYYSQDQKIWNQLALKNPEYLLLIGDNVFTDAASETTVQVTDPDLIWDRYVDMRFKNPLFFQEKLIPIHGLWNDHDYGVKDGNEQFHYKKESAEIFDIFYAQSLSDENWTKGLGVGGVLNLGDYNLFFLDARSFRSSDPEGLHLGRDQSAWFYAKLKEEAAPALIIKGDQFFGANRSHESYEENHPQDFSRFVNELKGIKTPFVFLSGERRMSEIMQFPRSLFGKPSFEITSGPVASQPLMEEEANPWRVVGEKGKTNFTLIDNLALDNHWFMDVESYGPHGERLFRRELAVYIQDLQNNLNEVRKRRRSGQRRYRKAPRRR